MKNPKFKTQKNHTEVYLEKCVCLISNEDLYLLKVFPCWKSSREREGVQVSRLIETEFGPVRQLCWLHRIIAKPPRSSEVDHINRDPKDNRRENLRHADRSQNVTNRKVTHGKNNKYIGIFREKRLTSKPWTAFVGGSKKRKYLGRYSTAEEAALVRDNAAKEIYGEFARLNFPDGKVGKT